MNQKTTELNIDGEKIDVSELPKDIRDSIDFFDKIGTDMAELAEDLEQMQYQRNVWYIAATAIKNKVIADVTEMLAAKKAVEDTAKLEDEAAEVEPSDE